MAVFAVNLISSLRKIGFLTYLGAIFISIFLNIAIPFWNDSLPADKLKFYNRFNILVKQASTHQSTILLNCLTLLPRR